MVVAASFGGRIQAARTRQGLTRRALAVRAGLSQSMLARVEAQSRAVSVPELLKIASALGTTLGDLTGTSPVRDRVTFSHHSGDEAVADAMRERLTYYLEMDAHLDDLGLAATV